MTAHNLLPPERVLGVAFCLGVSLLLVRCIGSEQAQVRSVTLDNPASVGSSPALSHGSTGFDVRREHCVMLGHARVSDWRLTRAVLAERRDSALLA